MADDTLDSDEESKNFQSAYLGGDRTALWNAIVFCAVHRIAHWEWLAAHIETTHHAAESGMIATWDDVFGRHPWGKGQQRGAQTYSRRFEVWNKVHDAGLAGKSINRALYEEIGGQLEPKLSGAVVEKLYGPIQDVYLRLIR
jgi:hypothetical protein